MAIVGNVEIDIVAKIARLEEGLNKANRKVGDFAGKATSHFAFVERGIKSMIGALAGIASVRALAQITTEAASAAEQIQNLSNRVGVSTQFINKLSFGAQNAGASFDDVSSALEKMDKATVQAAQGNDKMERAFDALGINVKKFIELDSEERFSVIAEAMKRAGSSASTTQASFAILGDSASKLDPILRQGAAGLAQLGMDAERAGAVMSDKTVSALNQLDDQLDKLDATWKRLKISIAETIGVPAVQWANDMVDAWRRLGQLGIGDAKEVFTSTTEQLAQNFRASPEGSRPLNSFLFSDVSGGESSGVIGKPKAISETAKGADAGLQKRMQSLQDANRAENDYQENLRATWENSFPPEDQFARVNALYEESQNEKLQIQRLALDAEFEAAIQTEKKLNELHDREGKKRNKSEIQLNEERRSVILGGWSSTLGALATLADGSNRKAFKRSQRLARAQAVVDSIAAGVAAGKSAAGLGPWAAFAAYASVVAGFAARITQINKMSYDGGGDAGGGGGGGGAPTATTNSSTPSGVPVNSSAPVQQMQIQVFVNGVLTGSQFTDEVLVPLLQDRIENKELVLGTRNSRMAIEFAQVNA